MDSILSYNSEEDKCYGATGMAISIIIYDADELLSAISLDAPPHALVELVDSFYFSGNPSLSAKNAWAQITRSFNISMAMTIGNVLCRSMVRDHHLPSAEVKKMLIDVITREGEESCSLEEDECRALFDKNYNYLYRVFNHRGVHDVAIDFAKTLTRMRRMTRMDVIDHLRGLHVL